MADKFVDFSAANDGDGTAHTQAASGGAAGAYNTLAGKTFSAGDKVWIRRKEKTGQTAVWTFNSPGVEYIGWPLSGDKYYDSRPVAAQGDWDGDVETHAKITHTSQFSPISVTTGAQDFHRIHFHSSLNSSTNNVTVNTSSGTIRCRFYNCIAEASDVSSSVLHNNFFIASPVDMWDCEGRYPGGQSGTNYGAAFTFDNNNASNSNLIRCTATIHTTSPSRTLMAGVRCVSGQGQNITVLDFTVGGTGIPTVGFNSMGNRTRIIGGSWKGITGFDGTASHYTLHNVKVTGFTTLITLSSNGGHFLSFRECVQAASTTQPIAFSSSANCNGILVLDSVNFHAGNTYNFQMAEGAWKVFMRNCTNIKASPNNPTSTGNFWPGYYSADHEGTAGAFRIQNYRGVCEASSVVRTGGEAFSLKCESINGVDNPPGGDLYIGWPGFETIWVALKAGSQTLTLYGAHKLFSTDPPTKENIWFEFDYMDGSEDPNRVCATTRENAALESDTSSWTGDTDLTAFKISKQVTVGQDCVVPVRIGYGKYVANAYTYIDPKIVVS